MIFESPKAIYKVVRIVKTTAVNDIYVCQDVSGETGSMFVVLLIKDHEVVHSLLKIFESSEKDIEKVAVESFSLDDNFVLVLPYVQERPLERFFNGQGFDLVTCEALCINLVVNLMTSDIPFPILYLVLTQKELHISRDKDIYLGFQLDLTELNDRIIEEDCVNACAEIILTLLETKGKENNPMSYDLIEKKVVRKSYDAFVELYKDIRLAAAPAKKRTLWARIKAFFRRNKDRIFKIILVVALVLGIFVAVSFLTNVFLGDIPWLRFLTADFSHIGTENLAK